MVFHARSAAQRREQRRRAEARFAGRLCKLVEQRHRGFVPARALVRAAAGCPQDASTQTQRDDLVDAETQTQEYFQQRNVEQIVIPPPQQLGIPQDRISERYHGADRRSRHQTRRQKAVHGEACGTHTCRHLCRA